MSEHAKFPGFPKALGEQIVDTVGEEDARETSILHGWDPESQTLLTAYIDKGVIIKWRVMGPVTELEARGIFENTGQLMPEGLH